MGELMGLVERVVDLTSLPEMMEQDGQLSRDGDDGSPFCIFPSSFSKHQPPTSQVTTLVPRMGIRSEGTQDVLSGTDEQAA